MKSSRILLSPRSSGVALALALLMLAPCSVAGSAAADSAPRAPAASPAPSTESAATLEGDSGAFVAAPLPPTAAGRSVIADVPSLVIAVRSSERRLKDFDAEASDVIAQINRSPSTWQTYLLYTAEDLPERLFMPGFTFVLGTPKKREITPLVVETLTTPLPAGN